MSRTPTRRIGRLRTLVVMAAMAVGTIAGTAAPAFADGGPDMAQPPGFDQAAAEHGATTAHTARFGGGGGDFSIAGFSWF
jgi:hypothetical protein